MLIFTFSSSTTPTVYAQDEVLTLEWEQHWPTYGVGGTCNFGTHNFFVGDVDGDGVTEIVTVGCMYVNQLCDPDLRIWSLSTAESANPFEYVVFAIAGVAVVVFVVVVGLYFGVKKRK
jgi:hypothetical protein